MRQWSRPSLVQIMACCLFGTKPLSEPMLGYYFVNWTHWNRLQWKFNLIATIVIQENALENVVCKMVMIPICRLWLHGLYGLNGPRCPLSSKRSLNLITHSSRPTCVNSDSAMIHAKLSGCWTYLNTVHYLLNKVITSPGNKIMSMVNLYSALCLLMAWCR